MGALHFHEVLNRKLKEQMKSQVKWLMYVDVGIGGKLARTLIDTGAIHNFIVDTEVR